MAAQIRVKAVVLGGGKSNGVDMLQFKAVTLTGADQVGKKIRGGSRLKPPMVP